MCIFVDVFFWGKIHFLSHFFASIAQSANICMRTDAKDAEPEKEKIEKINSARNMHE